MHIVVVKFRLKPEFRQRFIEAALDNASCSKRDESGCLRFDVAQEGADPNCIYFHGVYRDDAAFDIHTQMPHYERFETTVLREWYAAPPEVAHGRNLYPTDAKWD